MTEDSTNSTRRNFLTASAAGLVGASLAPCLYAAESGWIELFDGKTLKGWHGNPERIGHGTGGRWFVEDGAIHGEQDPPGSGNGGIQLTDRKFKNFELKIDMKPDWGVCSGLFLRGNDRGQCIQMMVDYHDAGSIGHLYGEGTGGFNTRTFDIDGVYDGEGDDRKLTGIKTSKHKSIKEVGLISSCTAEEWVKAWKINDWNTAHVKINGDDPHIVTSINGVKICEFDGRTTSNEKYKADREQILKTINMPGSVAVQVHGGKGWPNGARCAWKNILVREL
ncbi:MAG: 3-keto-disaccharide hydrolase [Planctomycetales bacterium]|jgi:hypothetical protein